MRTAPGVFSGSPLIAAVSSARASPACSQIMMTSKARLFPDGSMYQTTGLPSITGTLAIPGTMPGCPARLNAHRNSRWRRSAKSPLAQGSAFWRYFPANPFCQYGHQQATDCAERQNSVQSSCCCRTPGSWWRLGRLIDYLPARRPCRAANDQFRLQQDMQLVHWDPIHAVQYLMVLACHLSSKAGRWMVVRPGLRRSISGMSSKPAPEISSGTRRPRSRIASSTPRRRYRSRRRWQWVAWAGSIRVGRLHNHCHR